MLDVEVDGGRGSACLGPVSRRREQRASVMMSVNSTDSRRPSQLPRACRIHSTYLHNSRSLIDLHNVADVQLANYHVHPSPCTDPSPRRTTCSCYKRVTARRYTARCKLQPSLLLYPACRVRLHAKGLLHFSGRLQQSLRYRPAIERHRDHLCI